jgi:hypothetical protein
MTDEQVMQLQAGDRVTLTSNGVVSRYTIREIRARGTCVYERSKAFGHAYACFQADWHLRDGSTMDIGTSLESDEYIASQGYRVFGAAGERLTGWELI